MAEIAVAKIAQGSISVVFDIHEEDSFGYAADETFTGR